MDVVNQDKDTASTIRVMLIDDHPLMRRGIRQLLESESDFEVICEASNGTDAVAVAAQHDLDLIVLDLNMKGMSGLDTLNALRSEAIDSFVVILTVSDSPADITALLKAGADGYLLKDTEPDDLVNKLRNVGADNPVYSKEIQTFIDSNGQKSNPFEHLTQRETQILENVALGKRNREIAEQLFISESTVKVHMKSLLKKLNVPSRTAATVMYFDYYGKS